MVLDVLFTQTHASHSQAINGGGHIPAGDEEIITCGDILLKCQFNQDKVDRNVVTLAINHLIEGIDPLNVPRRIGKEAFAIHQPTKKFAPTINQDVTLMMQNTMN